MKKAGYTTLVLILGVFLFASPAVASAAWYNPFTWFNEKPRVQMVVQEEEQVAAVAAAPMPAPERVIEYVEKPVIKEVIKTVTQTVEDPATRQQLNDAVAKNNQLSGQIQQYQNLIKQYESANQTLNNKYADAIGVLTQCVGQLKSQPSYTPSPTIRCTSNTSTIDGTTFTICN